MSLLAVSCLMVPACAGNTPEPGEETSPQVESSPVTSPLSNAETAEVHNTEDVSGKTEIEVEMDDYYFEPTILKGDAGQELTLKFKNVGAELHNFTLQAQSIDTDVNVGESGEAKVTFPPSGGLVFFCEYHSVQNMRGELSST